MPMVTSPVKGRQYRMDDQERVAAQAALMAAQDLNAQARRHESLAREDARAYSDYLQSLARAGTERERLESDRGFRQKELGLREEMLRGELAERVADRASRETMARLGITSQKEMEALRQGSLAELERLRQKGMTERTREEYAGRRGLVQEQLGFEQEKLGRQERMQTKQQQLQTKQQQLQTLQALASSPDPKLSRIASAALVKNIFGEDGSAELKGVLESILDPDMRATIYSSPVLQEKMEELADYVGSIYWYIGQGNRAEINLMLKKIYATSDSMGIPIEQMQEALEDTLRLVSVPGEGVGIGRLGDLAARMSPTASLTPSRGKISRAVLEQLVSRRGK